MLNTPLISDLIFKGEVAEIKEIMKRSRELGMQTFDQSLFDLYESQTVTYEDALRNADSVNDLRLQIKLHSQRAQLERPHRRHRAHADRVALRAAALSLRRTNGLSRGRFAFHVEHQNLRTDRRRAASPSSAWA